MVLSTALFGKPAFRNLICNGLVLAEDGKKMSKRLKNYPSPMEIVNDYGAVSSVLYLCSLLVLYFSDFTFHHSVSIETIKSGVNVQTLLKTIVSQTSLVGGEVVCNPPRVVGRLFLPFWYNFIQ